MAGKKSVFVCPNVDGSFRCFAFKSRDKHVYQTIRKLIQNYMYTPRNCPVAVNIEERIYILVLSCIISYLQSNYWLAFDQL